MSEELEQRFERFAMRVRDFCLKIEKNLVNLEYIRQLLRCSSSVPANYIEASDDLGKADEKMKLKTARREAKESGLFLRLIFVDVSNHELEKERTNLVSESIEIKKILSTILIKLK